MKTIEERAEEYADSCNEDLEPIVRRLYKIACKEQRMIDIEKACEIIEDILDVCLLPGTLQIEDCINLFKKRME